MSIKRNCVANILVFALVMAVAGTAAATDNDYVPVLQLHNKDFPLDPFRSPPNRDSVQEPPWPEYYIDPTVDYWLNLITPDFMKYGLKVDTSYDRWEGLPTVSVDYFQSAKVWPDKTIFLSPSVLFSGREERFSFGAGVRQVLTDHTMVGVHAFHDWVRKRGAPQQYLREAGVGFEFSALPGWYSDLQLTGNLYFPVNERTRLESGGDILVSESLLKGADLNVGFQLPAMVSFLDARLDAGVHGYEGYKADVSGFNVALSVNTRDGMFAGRVRKGFETTSGDNILIEGSINLDFDWLALVRGEMPFSAPYQAPAERYERDLRQSLHTRMARKKDMPLDRTAKRIRLVAMVWGDTVSYAGGFSSLPNSTLIVQTSQSPWQDRAEITTDCNGMYSGQLRLEPGEYRIRLVHRPSGTVSNVKTVVIQE